MNLVMKAAPTLILMLLAIVSFAEIVRLHDPVGLLGWMFSLGVVLNAGPDSPGDP
jgi:hypothetical protein